MSRLKATVPKTVSDATQRSSMRLNGLLESTTTSETARCSRFTPRSEDAASEGVGGELLREAAHGVGRHELDRDLATVCIAQNDLGTGVVALHGLGEVQGQEVDLLHSDEGGKGDDCGARELLVGFQRQAGFMSWYRSALTKAGRISEDCQERSRWLPICPGESRRTVKEGPAVQDRCDPFQRGEGITWGHDVKARCADTPRFEDPAKDLGRNDPLVRRFLSMKRLGSFMVPLYLVSVRGRFPCAVGSCP